MRKLLQHNVPNILFLGSVFFGLYTVGQHVKPWAFTYLLPSPSWVNCMQAAFKLLWYSDLWLWRHLLPGTSTSTLASTSQSVHRLHLASLWYDCCHEPWAFCCGNGTECVPCISANTNHVPSMMTSYCNWIALMGHQGLGDQGPASLHPPDLIAHMVPGLK